MSKDYLIDTLAKVLPGDAVIESLQIRFSTMAPHEAVETIVPLAITSLGPRFTKPVDVNITRVRQNGRTKSYVTLKFRK